MTRRLSFAVVILLLAASVGCKLDAKTEEKRILAEIQRVAEESRSDLHSEESRSRLMRLQELRPSFPEHRDEMINEAEAIKQLFGRMIEDDKKIVDLYKSLLRLPLSENYAKCIDAQIRSLELTTVQSQSGIHQMELFSNPAIGDLEKLTEETNRIRDNPDLEKKGAELEAYLSENCRRPPASSETK